MEQRLWVVDQAVACVDNGSVTLQIDKPTRHLPRRMAFEVADKIWFAGQMRDLEIARKRGETKEIPLTNRRRRSSLRLGGGFMITQGTKLVVARRQQDASRPGQFCECGGVFEVLAENETEALDDVPEDVRNDYIASLLKESQEIVVVRGDTLYIPQLPPSQSLQVGFQPPGTLDAYNKIIEKEVIKEVGRANVPVKFGNIKRFWMKILDYDQAVRLEFAYSPALSVEITAEIETSSLECVGVLNLPEDIDAAVKAFEAVSGQTPEPSRGQGSEQQARPFEYWDTELGWDSVEKREGGPVDRDIHLIDTEKGRDIVWEIVPGERKRRARKSTLWKELSATKLGSTNGRFATEKLEKAVKMHCPFPRLQPLVRL